MASPLHLMLPHSSGYYRLHISCNHFVQPATHLFNPLSKSHKKNVFSFLSSTCYLEEFKLHRRDTQHTNCGLREGEQHGVDFMSLTSLNYNAEKRQPSEMERHSSNSFLSKYLNATKTDQRTFYDEKRLLEQNRRIQNANSAPQDFPNFIREGFDVKVVTSDSYVKCDSGLIYWDIKEGEGDYPKSGQQIVFNYQGYNESGRRIDSSYQQGGPAKTRVGINGLVPGFEEGIRTMRPGGKRRIVVPPELGPPVGPSTFFSSKQFEVFDVELVSVQDCKRRTFLFYSDVVCD
ncbi:peptidyl-prolyl cis-trans isomerase FKBP20-2, chloroplastic isoform X2 [Cryptomeria japonica]|uniref:peptidyl-prolyl cis-trans isomerase FKBP20-2, chloroplastic isoform X2 n=1 Tax=Cryptomeria japonica TaxID=3369 RepID=UPI0027DA089C|nr:peptidyl-prolyl cis-trans isomerase FKBP20-2, chloroplastic isoform X2 [Cryptomeria japonica]